MHCFWYCTHANTQQNTEPLLGSCFFRDSPLWMCGFVWYHLVPSFILTPSLPPTQLFQDHLILVSVFITQMSPLLTADREGHANESQQGKDSSHTHISLASFTEIILVLLNGKRITLRQNMPLISAWESQTLMSCNVWEISAVMMPEFMILLLKIIHGSCFEQFHVETIFFLYHYGQCIFYTSTRG